MNSLLQQKTKKENLHLYLLWLGLFIGHLIATILYMLSSINKGRLHGYYAKLQLDQYHKYRGTSLMPNEVF